MIQLWTWEYEGKTEVGIKSIVWGQIVETEAGSPGKYGNKKRHKQ